MNDSEYTINIEAQNKLKAERLFLKDPLYFKNVKISPSAAMKMMMHVQSGVEKGVKRSITGKPTEVMGLLIGRQCTEDPTCLIISDAQALPIEGFETSVVSDSTEMILYTINHQTLNEKSRHECEKFCGWYHSHPFDLEDYSHCYFSNTDISTQLSYQRACERQGDPWLGIVIDPLRSLARGSLELESFRAFPPEYTHTLNMTPDGTIVTDDRKRLSLWGAGWNRYYKLNTTYYMSSLSSTVLTTLKDNFLWQNNLHKTSSIEPEQRQSGIDRMNKVARELNALDGTGTSASSGSFRRGLGSSSSSSNDSENKDSSLQSVAQAASTCASEQCQHCCKQMSKLALFGNPNVLLEKVRAQGVESVIAELKAQAETDM
jgi:COP9 signalosome complex subunit 5